MKQAPVINSFTGEYRFLSNFWPVTIWLWAERYPSVEHAFQAAKTSDAKMRESIRHAETAKEAKRLGRKVPLRKDWEDTKLKVMEGLLRQKFLFSNYDLMQQLRKTRDAEIIEGNNWHDTFWGVCYCYEHDGVGENHLGKLLMKIRAEIEEIIKDDEVNK